MVSEPTDSSSPSLPLSQAELEKMINPFPDLPKVMFVKPDRISYPGFDPQDGYYDSEIYIDPGGEALDAVHATIEVVRADTLAFPNIKRSTLLGKRMARYQGFCRVVHSGVSFCHLENGMVVLTFVQDCLGFVVVSPEVGVTCCHLSVGDYSVDDLGRVLLPHRDYASKLSIGFANGDPRKLLRDRGFRTPRMPYKWRDLGSYLTQIGFKDIPVSYEYQHIPEIPSGRNVTVDSVFMLGCTGEDHRDFTGRKKMPAGIDMVPFPYKVGWVPSSEEELEQKGRR